MNTCKKDQIELIFCCMLGSQQLIYIDHTLNQLFMIGFVLRNFTIAQLQLYDLGLINRNLLSQHMALLSLYLNLSVIHLANR